MRSRKKAEHKKSKISCSVKARVKHKRKNTKKRNDAVLPHGFGKKDNRKRRGNG